MRWKIFFVLILVFFMTNFTYALFQFSESGSIIDNQYEISDYLKAKINMSFQNESINSVFNDPLGNSITLGNLLELIPDFNYSLGYSNTTISSGFHIINLNAANFLMPSYTGNFSYNLNFSNQKLFNETFYITSTNYTIRNELNKKEIYLNYSLSEIKKFDLASQKILNKTLNLSYAEKILNISEEEYRNSNPLKYNVILTNLSKIKIPNLISEISSTNSVSFYPERGNINLETIKEISGGEYELGKEEIYIDSIYFWNEKNLDTKIMFKEILIGYDTGEENTLRIFQFKFDKINMKNKAYFIIENIENIEFYEDYQIKKNNNYIYIDLESIGNEIIFSTEQDFNFINIPIYISPSLIDLTFPDAGEYTNYQDEKKFSKWLLFVLIIFLLIVIAIAIYSVLQTWYRRKYENHLFKNRNNLYNIMTYIQNAKKKGIERDEIFENLKKAKWTREQINYAIRKYEGKKIIGIIEKPFKKVLENIERTSPKR